MDRNVIFLIMKQKTIFNNFRKYRYWLSVSTPKNHIGQSLIIKTIALPNKFFIFLCFQYSKPCLTHWLPVYEYIVPVYEYIVLGNREKKTGIFRLTYQPHSSSADCAKELFKPSKDSASLRVCNEKTILGICFFVSNVISKVGFWLQVPDLGPITRLKYFSEVFIGN